MTRKTLDNEEIRTKIKNYKKKIEEIIETIAALNKDNVLEVKLDDKEITPFAEKMIKKYDLIFFTDVAYSSIDEIHKILKAKDEKEFIKALDEYVSVLEDWLESEKDLFANDFGAMELHLAIFNITEEKEIFSWRKPLFTYGLYRGNVTFNVYHLKFKDGFECYRVDEYWPLSGHYSFYAEIDDKEKIIEAFKHYVNSSKKLADLEDLIGLKKALDLHKKKKKKKRTKKPAM